MKMNPYHMNRLLGKCLVMEDKSSLQADVTEILQSPDFPWEQFVFFGSSHLVLPALHHAFRSLGMSMILPPELESHLENIFGMNDARNARVIEQAGMLNALLRDRGIRPVFMKGAATLLSGMYPHRAVRMLSDIDCLVQAERMIEAVELLKEEGYGYDVFRQEDLPFMHHFPTLTSPSATAAVDLHYLPVKEKYARYVAGWENRTTVLDQDSSHPLEVMGTSDLVRVNFLHSQLQDHGDYFASVSLKNLYEFHLLTFPDHSSPPHPDEFGRFSRKYRNYVALSTATFPASDPGSLKSSGSGPGSWTWPGSGASRSFLLRVKMKGTFRMYSQADRFLRTLLLQALHYAEYLLKGIFIKRYRRYLAARIREPGWTRAHRDHLSRKFR